MSEQETIIGLEAAAGIIDKYIGTYENLPPNMIDHLIIESLALAGGYELKSGDNISGLNEYGRELVKNLPDDVVQGVVTMHLANRAVNELENQQGSVLGNEKKAQYMGYACEKAGELFQEE